MAAKSKRPTKPRSNGKHPGGRPPKLDAKTLERIRATLSAGATKDLAAALAGVVKETLYDWLRVGSNTLRAHQWDLAAVQAALPPDDYGRLCAEFADFLEKAQAEGETALLTTIALASRARPARTVTRTGKDGAKVTETTEAQDGHWQAAAWLLERTRPDQYGRRDRMQVEGVKGGAPIVHVELWRPGQGDGDDPSGAAD